MDYQDKQNSLKNKLAKANESFVAENWQAASDYFEQAYNIEQTKEINHKLVESLFLDHQYTAAQSYVIDWIDDYFKKESDFRLVLSIYLANHHFLEARELLNYAPSKEVKQDGNALIISSEKFIGDELIETNKTLLRQFYHLSDYPIYEQQDRLNAASTLPLKEFLQGSKFILIDPYANPLIRSSILELLVRAGVKETIEFIWIDDKQYAIDLGDLVPFDQNKTFLSFTRFVKKTMEGENKKDPSMSQMIIEAGRLQMMIAYPRIDIAIPQPKLWGQALIATLTNNQFALPPQNEKKTQTDFREKLTKIANEMMQEIK